MRSILLRVGLGTLALSLLGSAILMIPENPTLAVILFVCSGVVGFGAICIALVAQRLFSQTQDKLGEFLDAADELMHRNVTNDISYSQWVNDLNSWYRQVNDFLVKKISKADAAVFRDTSHGYRVSLAAYNPDHSDYKQSLRQYIGNLRTIIERHSATR